MTLKEMAVIEAINLTGEEEHWTTAKRICMRLNDLGPLSPDYGLHPVFEDLAWEPTLQEITHILRTLRGDKGVSYFERKHPLVEYQKGKWRLTQEGVRALTM